MARVVIVEKDGFLGSAVAAVLETKGHSVQVHGDDVSAAEIVEHFHPDLAVIHRHEHEGDSAVVFGRRFRALSDAAMMFLMDTDCLDERIEAFEIGADDVLCKPIAIAELCARVQALLRRSGRIDRSRHTVGDLLIDELAHAVCRNDRPVDLTSLEFSLLMAMVRHRGQVLSKVQLLDEVWGFRHYDVNLVEVHVSALRRKLEHHGPRLIHTVRGAGYVLRAATRPAFPTRAAG